jgi:hypothetical protein
MRSVQPPVGEPENAKDQCCFPQGQQVEQRQSLALLSIAARLWGKRGPKISALYNRQMIKSKKKSVLADGKKGAVPKSSRMALLRPTKRCLDKIRRSRSNDSRISISVIQAHTRVEFYR